MAPLGIVLGEATDSGRKHDKNDCSNVTSCTVHTLNVKLLKLRSVKTGTFSIFLKPPGLTWPWITSATAGKHKAHTAEVSRHKVLKQS